MFVLTPEELTAIKLSIRVALVATLISLPFGVSAAMLIGRGRFLGRPLLNALVLMPLVLPPVVTQVPGGDAGALRLTLVSVVISLGAILAAEAVAQYIGRRIRDN